MTRSSKPLCCTDGGEPWKDKDRMLELYEEQDYTYAEMAEAFGCSDGTVSNWMKKHKADEIIEDIDVEIPDETPYRDPDLMERLYVEEQLSTSEISAVLDCSSGAVLDWLDNHGIDTRSRSEGMSIARGGPKDWYFYSNKVYGHECIKPNRDTMVLHHRLLAVSEFGLEAVKNKSVHHISGIPWDNRPGNLELLTRPDHRRKHWGDHNWLDHLRATEMYREGASSRDIAPTFDVDQGTIINWVREVDGRLVRGVGGGAA